MPHFSYILDIIKRFSSQHSQLQVLHNLPSLVIICFSTSVLVSLESSSHTHRLISPCCSEILLCERKLYVSSLEYWNIVFSLPWNEPSYRGYAAISSNGSYGLQLTPYFINAPVQINIKVKYISFYNHNQFIIMDLNINVPLALNNKTKLSPAFYNILKCL